ncbi:MAG: Gfo/Idh/MocA family oxidoreductase [Candidatus Omnitrophica bacterium]|nr:Gfo/Idh/MocA family oxidoreductase [Candidatus Omnitrophota bacterium]
MKNGKYQVAIVGAGGIARWAHMPGWQKQDDVEILAVADPDWETAQKFAADFNIPHVFTEYQKIAEMDQVDIVDVCAPNSVHCPASVSALLSGKHVLCEKPLAVKSSEVIEMITAANQTGKKLMCAQHQRFRKESRVVKDLIDDGVFGEIYFAQAQALRRRSVPARPTFIKKELSGGGPLLDIGVHILDLTYWFMGCPKVASVKGVTFTKLAKREDVHGLWGEWDRQAYDVEDFAAGFIRFTNGTAISLSCSFLANITVIEDFSTILYGTQAGIHWPNGKLATEKNGVLQDIELHIPQHPEVRPHAEEIRVFLECVRENKPVPVKPEESLEVIKMLEGIYQSAETGQEVIFAPAG